MMLFEFLFSEKFLYEDEKKDKERLWFRESEVIHLFVLSIFQIDRRNE